MKPIALLRIAIVTALIAAIVAAIIFLPTPQCLHRLFAWIKGLGPWGALFLIALYVAFCVLLLPGSVLTTTAGFMFGAFWGAVASSLGATLGAMAAFLLGRFALQGWLEGKLATHPRFLAIDRAIGEQGFKIVFLVRLATIVPYDLTSYLFGVTKVRWGRFLLGTWLGRLPEIVVFAYLGSTAKNLADVASGRIAVDGGKQFLMWLGLAAMVAVAIMVARIARRALRESVNGK
jgi:uncharacterized membrane protein YdjX (TVP38/TMEM64 family)